MVQDKSILIMANQYKVVYDLSIGAIFSDLERPPNQDFKVTSILDAENVSNGTR